MTLPINATPGILPRFWDRGVVYFCNIHSIFYENREETEDLMKQIYGAHSYGSRVISILNLLFRRGPNRILLEAPPVPDLLDYLAGDLELSLPSFEVLDRRGYEDLVESLQTTDAARPDAITDGLRRHPAQWVDGFVTDRTLADVAARLNKRTLTSPEASKNGNNKYLLYRHQLAQGLPVFDTLIAASRGEIDEHLKTLRAMGYEKAVVKAQIGASGYGMIKLATEDPASQVPNYLFFEGPCMVQGWIDDGTPGYARIGSPSIQLFLDDESVALFDWTEQILSDASVHEGNVSPPPYAARYPGLQKELFRQGGVAGAWLHQQGYRGTASADFLVVDRRGRVEVILCEINARVTGATYPAVLARHFLPNGCWSMRNISFRRSLEGGQILSLLDRGGVLYRPGKPEGVLPFNFNIDAEGKTIKGQFLCLGATHESCDRLLARAWRELPVDWGYDRD